MYLCQTDPSFDVRAKAKEALLSFGECLDVLPSLGTVELVLFFVHTEYQMMLALMPFHCRLGSSGCIIL